MGERDDLIAAKGQVQARIRALRPKVEAALLAAEAARGSRQERSLAARAASLRADLDALMAEEARLRVEIDRARR